MCVALDVERQCNQDVAADGGYDADQARPVLEFFVRVGAIAVVEGEPGAVRQGGRWWWKWWEGMHGGFGLFGIVVRSSLYKHRRTGIGNWAGGSWASKKGKVCTIYGR